MALGLPQCQDLRRRSRASAVLPSGAASSWLGAKRQEPGGDRDERGLGQREGEGRRAPGRKPDTSLVRVESPNGIRRKVPFPF